MRVVSGTLAAPLQPGDRIVFLLGHARSYALEASYTGRESPIGQPISIMLITLPGPNPGRHPLLEFDVERVVRIALEDGDRAHPDMACDDTTSLDA